MGDAEDTAPSERDAEALDSPQVYGSVRLGSRMSFHLPIVGPGSKILGVFSVRDALPREIGNAVSLAEFHEQVNDALG